MNTNLGPYPRYRDSGIPWLGQIPEHWDALRCKYLFREVDKRSVDGAETHLSMSQKLGLIPSANLDGKRLQSESYAGGKLCQTNDLVLNRLKAHLGVFARATHPGVISPDYTVLRPVGDANVSYYEHLFKTPSCVAELRRSTKGVVEGFWRLYTDDFYRIRVPVPPIEEQSVIVRFLDANAVLVRKLIRNRRQLIKTIGEQKRAFISRAISRGLNHQAPTKPSGIEWLGDIPSHWSVMPMKRFATINPARSEFSHMRASTEQVTFLPMEKVSASGHVDYSLMKPISEVWQGFTYFQRNDVVVAKITPCFENGKGACLSEMPTQVGFGTTEFMVLRALKEVSPAYLYAITASPTFRRLGKESMTGAAGQQRVSADFVANFPAAIPPISEQNEIISYIASGVQDFDRAIDVAEKEIQIVNKYRSRLTEDVVYGGIDVTNYSFPAFENTNESIDDDLDSSEEAEYEEDITNVED